MGEKPAKIKKIIFTGGGSAGHVTPNLALIKKFRQEDWEIEYIGSYDGIEKEIITKADISYHPISTGKLRRYFSWKNFLDLFNIFYGIIQALILCYKLKPNVIFSKGGFVSFPVVIAAWLNRIPVVIHEADLTVGLANKLCFPFASKVCITFPETIDYMKSKDKVVVTGVPIRESFFHGDAAKGMDLCSFTANKKIILVFGGSVGSGTINQVVRQLLPGLLDNFQVVHICGENKIDLNCDYVGYKQFTYLYYDFPHLLAAADLVIARSGANSIYEIIAMRKPNILIPLPKTASRGDQIVNAEYCVNRGFSEMILSEDLTPELLLQKISLVEKNHDVMGEAMKKFVILNSVELIYKIIREVSI